MKNNLSDVPLSELERAVTRLEQEREARLAARRAAPGYSPIFIWLEPDVDAGEALARYKAEHPETADGPFEFVGWSSGPEQEAPATTKPEPFIPQDTSPRASREHIPSAEESVPAPQAAEEATRDWALEYFRRHPAIR
jgi:hypothetical protein